MLDSLLANNGSRHLLTSPDPQAGLKLGAVVDAETDGQPNASATGDDTNGSPDDEDGVTLPAMTRGQPATINYTVADVGVGGRLNAWIDWDASGTFEPGEQIAVDVNPANHNGGNTLNINVPLSAVTGTPVGVRFRWSTQTGLLPTGAASDGEVEDYLVTINLPPTAARLAYFRAVARGAGGVQVSWGTLVENGVLGFRVDRDSGDGGWQRVTGQLIPATGGNYAPQSYGLADAGVLMATELSYRLIEVNLSGQENVLAEVEVQAGLALRAEVSEGSLRLEFRGEPNGTGLLETTVDPVRGPWEAVATIRADATGKAAVSHAVSSGEPMRFFRIRE